MGVKYKLLATPPEKVPHEFAQEVIDFCKPIDAVTAAWVGLTEITEDFKHPYEQLAAAYASRIARIACVDSPSGDSEIRVAGRSNRASASASGSARSVPSP